MHTRAHTHTLSPSHTHTFILKEVLGERELVIEGGEEEGRRKEGGRKEEGRRRRGGRFIQSYRSERGGCQHDRAMLKEEEMYGGQLLERAGL